MLLMRDRIQDALTHRGQAVGISSSGLEYLIRPAKNFPSARLVEIYRTGDLLYVKTMTELSLWADSIGMVIV